MYTLVYDEITGKAIPAKVVGSVTFCIYKGTPEYEEFLRWNKAQKTPLDLNSTIPVVPPVPARDVYKELDLIRVDVDKLKEGKVDKI